MAVMVYVVAVAMQRGEDWMMGWLEAGLDSISGLMACPSVGVLAYLAPRCFDGDCEGRTMDSGWI